jgi:hypothetical protein
MTRVTDDQLRQLIYDAVAKAIAPLELGDLYYSLEYWVPPNTSHRITLYGDKLYDVHDEVKYKVQHRLAGLVELDELEHTLASMEADVE